MLGFNIRTRYSNGTESSSPGRGSPGSIFSPKQTDTPNAPTSPRTEKAEIDTRAPFQSVKAAVSLFGEAGASPKSRPVSKKPKNAEERVLEKETLLHLALKELEDLKVRLRSTEAAKAQAHRELDKANATLQTLTNKLQVISESKQTAIEATEAAKQRAKELEDHKSTKLQEGSDANWKQDVNAQRQQYKASAAELISAKQQLTTLRQDLDAVLEAKLAAFQQAADAQHSTQVNQEKLTGLSKEIATLRESLAQVKQASLQAQEEQDKQIAELQARIHSYQMCKEQAESKIKSLKESCGESDLDKNLEDKLEETTEAIKILQEQLTNVKTSDASSLADVTAELENTKSALQKIEEEKISLQGLVDSMKLELENVQKERLELSSKVSEAESVANTLRADLDRHKAELEAGAEGRLQPQDDCNDILRNIEQLQSEAENARREVEGIKKNVAMLEEESKRALVAEKEAEENLQNALKDVEEAKTAERRAENIIHDASKADDASASSSEHLRGKIKLSHVEYESMKKKVEESKVEADVKVATVMAQIETIRGSESEILKKLEANMKEKEELEGAIESALKQAEMAEAAKKVVEGELAKWREKEQQGKLAESST